MTIDGPEGPPGPSQATDPSESAAFDLLEERSKDGGFDENYPDGTLTLYNSSVDFNDVDWASFWQDETPLVSCLPRSLEQNVRNITDHSAQIMTRIQTHQI